MANGGLRGPGVIMAKDGSSIGGYGTDGDNVQINDSHGSQTLTWDPVEQIYENEVMRLEVECQKANIDGCWQWLASWSLKVGGIWEPLAPATFVKDSP